MAGFPGIGEGCDSMRLLDLYIYDYMKKNNMPKSAENFARITNIQDLPPGVIDTPKGFLTEWWLKLWDTNSQRMQLNSVAESSSSSIQPGNVMDNDYHQEAPVVVDQPVPFCADMDTTMMTVQQPAAHLLAANYQEEHSGLNSQLFGRANQYALAQALAQSQVNKQARAQAIAEAREAQIQASRNSSSHQLQALIQTLQQLPPRGNRHGGNGASVGSNQQSSEEADNYVEVDKPEKEVVYSSLSDMDAADDDTGNSFTTLHKISSVNISGNQGFSFKEVCSFRLSKAKVLCCSFSPDGKYLASAGHERKVNIWNMDSLSHEVSAEGHSNIITDVRFRAVSTVFATSSFDKTVQLWDAPRSKSLLTLHGHVDQVMSVDFHPQKHDLLCSCDSNNEIRLWDAHQNDCISVFKGASRQIRFQPQTGNLLAATSGNVLRLIDIDTKMSLFKLEGHANDIRSLCWDPTGEYLASVSEDRARIWSTVGGGKCVYELVSNGNKFEACTFHPGDNQLLVIGSYQILDLWNPVKGNKTESIEAHEGIISSVADSHVTNLIASASHDHNVKIWR